MAEVQAAVSSSPELENIDLQRQSLDIEDTGEPKAKKIKVIPDSELKLEERLNGILRCTVCLDLPRVAMYQCNNGHLMCAMCFSHLLADARLKDETATCPNCRCEISKSQCSRNLAVEKAVSELPTECQYCSKELPRHMLHHHEQILCQDRIVCCQYTRIGCPWQGPYHELTGHEQSCLHPNKTGQEIMETLKVYDDKRAEEMKIYDKVFNMLSCEKITFMEDASPVLLDWVIKGRDGHVAILVYGRKSRVIPVDMSKNYRDTSPVLLDWVIKGQGGHVAICCLRAEEQGDPGRRVKNAHPSLLLEQGSDLQLRPYRTDDFITKLYYETSRFTAFGWQWVIKARVNDNVKNPANSTVRNLNYQLICKSRLPNPIQTTFLMVQGPFGEMKIAPAVYSHQFTNDVFESEYQLLPIDSHDCNRLLAGKTIGVRLIMLQVVYCGEVAWKTVRDSGAHDLMNWQATSYEEHLAKIMEGEMSSLKQRLSLGFRVEN